MPFPAIAAALARLAPMIESAMASGGAAAAAGRAGAGAAGSASSAGAGLSEMLGGMLRGPAKFGSSQELGAAVQRLEDIASLASSLRDAQTALGQDQGATAARFREDERLYMAGSPDDTAKLAALEQQRAANARQQADLAREARALEGRVGATNNPPTTLQNMTRAAGLIGTASFAASMLPRAPAADPGLAGQLAHDFGNVASAPLGPFGGLVRSLPPFATVGNMMQGAMQPATDLGMDRAEGNVLGGMSSFASKGASIAMNPWAMLKGEGIAHMARLPGLIRDWGEALVESKRGLAQFNGSIAIAFAEAERRGIVRSIESGSRIGGATAGLSDALQDLADTMHPVKDAVTIVMTRTLEGMVRYLDGMAKHIGLIYEALKNVPMFGAAVIEAERRLAAMGRGTTSMPLTDFIKDVRDRPIGQDLFVRPRR